MYRCAIKHLLLAPSAIEMNDQYCTYNITNSDNYRCVIVVYVYGCSKNTVSVSPRKCLSQGGQGLGLQNPTRALYFVIA